MAARNWVFTIQNPDQVTIAQLIIIITAYIDDGSMAYAIFGEETAPTTGTEHL